MIRRTVLPDAKFFEGGELFRAAAQAVLPKRASFARRSVQLAVCFLNVPSREIST
jgi:hypothetical protein